MLNLSVLLVAFQISFSPSGVVNIDITQNDNIILVYERENLENTKAYFKIFRNEFDYLNSIQLKYTPEAVYSEYESDLNILNMGHFETAEIIDTRNIPWRDSEPVRILLKNSFFTLSTLKKHEVILHEIGHYFTNPRLLTIRKYIADVDPPLLGIRSDNHQMNLLVLAHNKAINYIFQIPKLIQEMNGELWVYENQPKYSEQRLKGYCAGVKETLPKIQAIISLQKDFLYKIPAISSFILFRKSVLRNTNFNFTQDCLLAIEEINREFLGLVDKAGWQTLKLVEHQRDVLGCLEYNNENIIRLTELYEIILSDFVVASSEFFPEIIHSNIIAFYELPDKRRPAAPTNLRITAKK